MLDITRKIKHFGKDAGSSHCLELGCQPAQSLKGPMRYRCDHLRACQVRVLLFLGLRPVSIRLPLACCCTRPAAGADGLLAGFVPRAGLARGRAVPGLGTELQAEGHLRALTCRGDRSLAGLVVGAAGKVQRWIVGFQGRDF